MDSKAREIDLLGLKVHDLTMNETLDLIEGSVAEGRFFRVLTLNPEIAYGAWQQPAQAALVNSADLVTADGTGILRAARTLGTPLREKVTGIDLFTQLAARCGDGRFRFYLFGAKEGVARDAAQKLTEQYPNLQIAGCRNGYFQDSESPAIATAIRESHADILICAMGAPRQDQWLAQYGPLTGAAVGIGVGGSLDVVAGNVKRAPQFFQKHGLEWLWRIARDPKRWKRSLVLPRFLRYVKRRAGGQK